MATEFYSTHFNKTVDIPNNKVCGYRMSNRATKKGWSSGVRSGKDNGVAPQKFSRYATDWEAECKHKCDGNRNWLNKDQRINFTKIKQGRAFQINRPAFYAGEIERPSIVPNLKPNERKGLGNREIIRPNFNAPPIKGREHLDFEKLQAQDIETGGIKVQIADKSFEKLFKVQVPDPDDREWLAEKARRIGAGETEEQIKQNPPFGRPQRTISKNMNFGAMNMSIDNHLSLLKQAIQQGGADNRLQMAQLIANTANLVNRVDTMRQMTDQQLRDLQSITNKLNIPTDWQKAGFTHRLYNDNQYRNEMGEINVYLLAHPAQGTPPGKPVVLLDNDGNPQVTVPVSGIDGILSGPNKSYLDLQSKTIITSAMAVEMARSGVDNGVLAGIPAAPPMAPAGIPTAPPMTPIAQPTPPPSPTQSVATTALAPTVVMSGAPTVSSSSSSGVAIPLDARISGVVPLSGLSMAKTLRLLEYGQEQLSEEEWKKQKRNLNLFLKFKTNEKLSYKIKGKTYSRPSSGAYIKNDQAREKFKTDFEASKQMGIIRNNPQQAVPGSGYVGRGYGDIMKNEYIRRTSRRIFM